MAKLLQQSEQGLLREFAGLVTGKAGNQVKRPGEKHRIDDCSKRRQNVLGSLSRRNNQGDQARDRGSRFIREEEYAVLHTLNLVQFLIQVT